MPDIQLTEQQESIFQELQKFVQPESQDSFFLVLGSAGTGKTTLINHFIKWYHDRRRINLDGVVVTAPTNKAVRVLRRMNKIKGVEYKTLHSLLGLRPEIRDEDGVQVFLPDRKNKPSISLYGVVIVDEASMIDDVIFNELLIQGGGTMKFIFVGDRDQIPPVNHDISKPMTEEIQKKYKFLVHRLTEIVRQAVGNPIIQVATDIRNGCFTCKAGDVLTNDEVGFYFTQNGGQLKVLLEQKFTSEKFQEDSDYAKIIAWKNATVDMMNKTVRDLLYYKGVNKIVQGEKLVLNAPVIRKDEVLLHNNDDLVVDSLDIGYENHHGCRIKFYIVSCHRLDEETPHSIKVIHEDSEADHAKIIEQLRKAALAEQSKAHRSKRWKEFYGYLEKWADVSYNYAITCHRSQGSTYENAFVLNRDIACNSDVEERRRILYTAVTRPRSNLFFF